MEAHRQQCQSCHSIETRNIIVRHPDRLTMVYVRCSQCGQLIARYVLSAYYHHGKGLESFLRSRGSVNVESGRRMLSEFKQVQDDAQSEFAEVLAYLKEHDKPV